MPRPLAVPFLALAPGLGEERASHPAAFAAAFRTAIARGSLRCWTRNSRGSFPALAATSMEQGRVAAHHACGEPLHEVSELQPIGIYSIPEISFVGRTEEQLTRDNVPFEVGVSRYRELARGQIIGDSYGVLKLLVSPVDRTLLGVHVFGTGATELVHIGQAVMGCGGTVDYLVDAVFNYPTLAECYKVSALNAANKLAISMTSELRIQR